MEWVYSIRTLSVSFCGQCPFLSVHREYPEEAECRADGVLLTPGWASAVPSSCPLRKGPMMVSIEKGQ